MNPFPEREREGGGEREIQSSADGCQSTPLRLVPVNWRCSWQPCAFFLPVRCGSVSKQTQPNPTHQRWTPGPTQQRPTDTKPITNQGSCRLSRLTVGAGSVKKALEGFIAFLQQKRSRAESRRRKTKNPRDKSKKEPKQRQEEEDDDEAMDASKVCELQEFVEACKKDPSLLADPNLAFFRDYLHSLGAKIPAATSTPTSDKPKRSSMDDIDDDDDEDLDMRDATPEPDELDEEIVESDLELEGDIVQSDQDDPPQKMGDPSVEVTEENRDASQEAKGKAMEAMSEGKLDDAIEHLTKAILLNPLSAIMYGTRASVFIKMKKPVAAIRDANAALEINPDSAKGYKTRGMAYAMLGKWEEAASDLHTASNMDFDEEINAVLKKVEPNAHKIVEHRRKYERLRKEREEKRAERDRLRRRAEAQAAYDKAKKKEQSSSRSSGGAPPRGFPGGVPGGGFPGGMPGGFPGGAMPGGFPGGAMPGGAMPGGVPGNVDMSKILNDPELMAAFSDPEVMAALQDVMNNPASFARHQANPKVGPIIAKMMGKFGGSQ